MIAPIYQGEGSVGEVAVLERVLAGDADVFAELIADAWPRFGTGLLASGALDRGDLEQEAAAVLVETARSFDPAEGDFRELAVGRVRRHLRSILRAERRRRSHLVRLAGQDVATARGADPLAGEVEHPRLVRLLKRMSPRVRAVIARVYWQDASTTDIARAEGRPVESVRQARLRALVLLRQELRSRRWRPRH